MAPLVKVGSDAATSGATLDREPRNVKRYVGFSSIVLDCDSTLVTIEGIDVLAQEHAAAIRALTDAAMEGAIPLEEVYGRRLEMIRPDRAAVLALGEAYLDALVPDARETLQALLWLGKQVRVLSGGLRPAVEAVAGALNIPPEHVAAVDIWFDSDGAYRDFERTSPLARSGGKAEVISAWKLPRPVLLVGDGATDLEARPAVDAFAAFTGVVQRPAVVQEADVALSGLAGLLALASDPQDRARLQSSPWANLLADADRIIPT